MSKLISITSGSKTVLNEIINRYPDHKLVPYKSINENNLKLIDWYPSKSIFKLPLTYHIKLASKSISFGPFINLCYFTLTAKEQKILTTYLKNQLIIGLPSHMTSLFQLADVNNPAEIIIGSSWSSNQNLFQWLKNSFIQKFISDSNNESFHNNLVQLH